MNKTTNIIVEIYKFCSVKAINNVYKIKTMILYDLHNKMKNAMYMNPQNIWKKRL
jgi:hypothetical protein